MSYPVEYINPDTGEVEIVNNDAQARSAAGRGLVIKRGTEYAEPTGWTYSDRMVADYVYNKNGKVYFLYNISSVTDEPNSFIEYEATGLSIGDYDKRWDNDSLGNARTGPEMEDFVPNNFNVISSQDVLGPKLTMSNFTITRTQQGITLGDYIGQTMEGLEELYPFLFEEVEGRLPALGLIFNSLVTGKAITQEQMSLAGVGKGFTKLKLDYLNATIAASAGDPSSYNYIDKDTKELIVGANQEYLAHEAMVERAIDTSLSNLGISVDVFKKDNPELYKSLVTALSMGDIEYDKATGNTIHFEKYLGYRLGLEGYSVDKESAMHNLYGTVDTKVNAPGQFNAFVDFDTFKSSETAKAELISYIGIGEYNALDEDERTKLIGMYSTDANRAKQEYQKLFDNNVRFERFKDRELRYSLIAGQYKQNYQNIFGEAADETSSIFLDNVGNSYTDATKNFMKHAYKTGNDNFMRTIANNISNSFGGVVIR